MKNARGQDLTPGARVTTLGLVLALFVGSNLYNALTKGGDFTVFLESGRRLLHAESLYAGSRVAEGVVGPPFQAVGFVPFAWLARHSETASRLAWYALNLVALLASVLWWQRALERPADVEPQKAWWQRATGSDVLLALVAVAHPLQANFQHQNLNLILLALLGAAALAAREGDDRATGVFIGAATATKAFPGLLLVYLLCKGRWRALTWGVGTAAALTTVPVFWYGLDGWLSMLRDWLQVSGTGGGRSDRTASRCSPWPVGGWGLRGSRRRARSPTGSPHWRIGSGGLAPSHWHRSAGSV
jgi:hypothetical protein